MKQGIACAVDERNGLVLHVHLLNIFSFTLLFFFCVQANHLGSTPQRIVAAIRAEPFRHRIEGHFLHDGPRDRGLCPHRPYHQQAGGEFIITLLPLRGLPLRTEESLWRSGKQVL